MVGHALTMVGTYPRLGGVAKIRGVSFELVGGDTKTFGPENLSILASVAAFEPHLCQKISRKLIELRAIPALLGVCYISLNYTPFVLLFISLMSMIVTTSRSNKN